MEANERDKSLWTSIGLATAGIIFSAVGIYPLSLGNSLPSVSQDALYAGLALLVSAIVYLQNKLFNPP